ncbi:hypothetical protein [Comamonas endophytica]|uniref:SMI1/KNR4 family protein n=1 Tax=Comamonas endophytica TaxID=2949090 RepID=A0ABY6GEH8_9BURK|nr:MULTISPECIES: hypothetical protein [unclassified Acidovorax]MCD2513146.1 hypothetical protein [Acidovorax sp. D4N7]UYG53503.1 hypothetical protein M9799_19240 [Acidovorax sp. 5MLIR]
MNIELLQAEAFLRTVGLSLPALPAELADRIRERAPGIYCTREIAASPYEVEAYLAELLSPANSGDYALLAIDGHGIQSWAFHYYLVSGPLALFVQLPWGGLYTDVDTARPEIDSVLAWTRTLLPRLAELKQQGRLTPEQRLLVVYTRFSRSGWAWIERPEAAMEDIRWQPPAQMFGRIDAELSHLSEKQHT